MATRRGEQNIDWVTFSIYLTMIGVGWLMIYTVGYNEGYEGSSLDLLGSTMIGKQTIWIAISLLLLFLIQLVDWKFWRTFAFLVYGFGLIILALVLGFGSEIKGAKSWFVFAGFSFQPVEIAKFGTALAVAAHLNNFNTNLKTRSGQLTTIGIILAPIFLVMLQPDAGSALVFLAFFIPFYREGFPSRYYAIGAVATTVLLFGLVFPLKSVLAVLFLIANLVLAYNFKKFRTQLLSLWVLVAGTTVWGLAFAAEKQAILANIALLFTFLISHWTLGSRRLVGSVLLSLVLSGSVVGGANYFFNEVLKSHQQERINVWLRPSKCDPRGSLYNVLQSKRAIGSGGFQGKGFLEGNMTKLNYVPEQATDFIFCTVGEEQGFIGAASVILLFLLLIYRITMIAERQRSKFSRVYAYGVASILFVHVFINIGMTMGLMPIIGIPLPFISKGGSSLLGFTLLIGVLLKMDTYREFP